jgi:hypothetical protein
MDPPVSLRGQAVLPQCNRRVKVVRFFVPRVSTLTRLLDAGHYFLPHPPVQYRIKYPMYRISANSPDEAKRKVVKLLDGNLNDLISIEADYSAQPTWKRFLTGK